MTVGQLKQLFTERLSPVMGEREAKAVFLVTAEELAGISRAQTLLDAEQELRQDIEAKLIDALAQLEQHRPVQYVLGCAEFCGMRFNVGEGTLIPRPETEELVRLIAEDWRGQHPVILDVGTGSGAIAVALAVLLPGARVVAVDISERALDYARRNAEANGAKIEFHRLDILSPDVTLPAGRFDVIVSNPPYVPLSEKGAMARNVADYEPHEALFVEDGDPLVFYRAIARLAGKRLARGGGLYFEIFEKSAAGVCALLAREGFPNAKAISDINTKERIVRWKS